MTVRKCLIAGWLGCLGASALAPPAEAQGLDRLEPGRINRVEPELAANPNQQTAEAIVAALKNNAQLKGYRIDVVFAGGVAELHGHVLDAGQRAVARQTAMTVAGVSDVRDRLSMGGSDLVSAAQEFVPNPPAFPPSPNPIFTPMTPGFQPMPMPPGAPGAFQGEQPVAAFHSHHGAMPNPQFQPPPMPPNAWPSYAPYNNYSRVAYPKLFAGNQWPFIGPMYPYPKVPLGWRKITLEWQDGSWWYGREASSHDWWRVRYW